MRSTPPRWPALAILLVLLVPGLARCEDLSGELRIARAYLESARYADALKTLAAITQRSPDSAEARFLQGEVYKEAKQLGKAKRFYLKTLAIEPSHKDAGKELYEIVRAEARGRKGAAVYEQLIEAGVYLPPVLLELFQLYRSRRKTSTIFSLSARFIRRLEENKVPLGFKKEASQALTLAAQLAYKAGDLDKSRELAEAARDQHGGVDGLSELNKLLRDQLVQRATPAKIEGDKYALQGRYSQALEEYKRALAIYPTWPQVKDNLLAVNNLVEAEELYDEAVQLHAKGNTRGALTKLILGLTKPIENVDLQSRVNEVIQKIEGKKGEIEAAERDRKQAANERQSRFAAAYQAGEDAAKGGRWIDAAKHYREAVDLFPKDERVLRRLNEAEKKAELERTFEAGKKAYRKKQYQAALANFQTVREADAADTSVLRFLALTYFYLNRHAKAEPLAEQVLADRKRDREMFYILGVIADEKVRAGDARPVSAISWFEKIEADDPNYLDIGERLSRLRWSQNRIPLLGAAVAFVFWGAMMFWSKYRGTIYKNRFLAKIEGYTRREKWDALCAIEEEARAYPLDKRQDLAVNTALAQAFYHTKNWQKAINWGQSALARNREDPALIQLMGRIYFEGRIISQDILRFLLALAEAEPDNIELMRFIGEFCLEKQVVNDETMPILRSLAMAMPQHDKLRRMLIRGYLRNNETGARALALYRVELEKDPDRVDLRYYVAQDSLKAGRTEECIKHCEQILNIRLNHPETHEVLRQAYAKLGKLDELARIYQGILENDPYNPAVQDSLKKILATG